MVWCISLMQLIKDFNCSIFLKIIRKKQCLHTETLASKRPENCLWLSRERPMMIYDGHRKGHGPESRTIDSSVWGIPTWQASLHDGYPYMTGIPTWWVSLHDRCPYMTWVPTWRASLHERCLYMIGVYMTGVLMRQVSLHDRYPHTTCVVSLHDRCLHDRCPYMTGVPTW